MTTMRRTEAGTRLRGQFDTIEPSMHIRKWDELYNQGFIPWDRGMPNPALIDVLVEREDLLPIYVSGMRRKALVPGVSSVQSKSTKSVIVLTFGFMRPWIA
jgi:hypothetical protein